MKLKTIIGYCMAVALFATSCKSDDKEHPSPISDVTATPYEGAIKLSWEVPSDSNYYYVKCNYYNPVLKQEIMQTASVYSDTMLIEDLYNAVGEYKFTLRTVSYTNTESAPISIEAECLPRPVQYKVVGNSPIALNADMLSTDKQEASEGALANLVDGQSSTYFHSDWSTGKGLPCYIDIDLANAKLENGESAQPLEGFNFWYQNRNNSNGKPSVIEIEVSNDGVNFELFDTINSGLPNGAGATFQSSNFIFAPNAYKYIRLNVTAANGNNFFNMAQLKLNATFVETYDPEAEIDF